jgi:hypothetical protein
MGRHDLWPDDDYDEFKRRYATGRLVTFENGRWWRRGFNHATLIDDDKPFLVSINGQTHDYTHTFEPPRIVGHQ